jgi:voltage-gated potassium channel
MDPVRHLRFSLAALVAVIVLGTLGYSLIESWPLFDALYMTIITLSTVGFKEVYTLSPEGKLFTIILIISGTGMIAYSLAARSGSHSRASCAKYLGGKNWSVASVNSGTITLSVASVASAT